MSHTRKLNVVILGTSFISLKVALDLKEAKHVNLLGIVSRDKNRATEIAKSNNIQKGFDVQEVINSPEIDLIYIAVPNKVHAETAIQFMKAGKHVILEKPMASTEAEVQAILRVSKETNRFCMEALMYQCHPFIDDLLKVISARLSRATKITATYVADIYKVENKEQGGAIRNLGCYPASLVRLIANAEPVSIKNITGIMDDVGERDQFSKITLEFKDGLTADITTSNTGKMFWDCVIEGENGFKIQLITNPWLPEKMNKINILDLKGHVVNTLVFTAQQPLYSYQFDHAAEQIMAGKIFPMRPGVTWEHSLGNVRVLEHWFSEIKKQHDAELDQSNGYRLSTHTI